MCNIVNVSGDVTYAHQIHNLDKECFFNDCWSYELIEAELSSKKNIYLICKLGEKIVGYLNASVVLDEAELNRIAVSPLHRRNGIANFLMDSLLRQLESSECTRLMLEVRSQNKGALALYDKCGFKTDTVRKNYYKNPSDDAILMSLEL